jgi:hypothetical protein
LNERNVQRVLDLLRDEDRVLDVGGWACPFNRAEWILDSEPYETRGFYRTFGGPPSQGGEREWFTPETWIRRDICGVEPWPFEDQFFDYAICSHTLEDVRDPLRVCSELMRVAKRGYIETPSRLFESTRGFESKAIVGLSHHRWFVEADETGLVFLMKYHFVHSDYRYSFPPAFGRRLSEEEKILCFWWDRPFSVTERFIHGLGDQMSEVEGFVRKRYQYPRWRGWASSGVSGVDRIAGAIRRRLLG